MLVTLRSTSVSSITCVTYFAAPWLKSLACSTEVQLRLMKRTVISMPASGWPVASTASSSGSIAPAFGT